MRISKQTIYHVTDERDGDNYWNEWRTDETGSEWENLMGMSWECIDPPERLKEAFLAAMRDGWE